MYQQARQKLGLGIDKSAESLIPTFQAPVPTSFRFNQDTPGYIEDVKFALWLCESVSKCEELFWQLSALESLCGRNSLSVWAVKGPKEW